MDPHNRKCRCDYPDSTTDVASRTRQVKRPHAAVLRSSSQQTVHNSDTLIHIASSTKAEQQRP